MANRMPIIEDQYTAARAYFLSVIGLLFIESLIRLPSYLLSLWNKGRPIIKPSRTHSKAYTLFHKILTLPSAIPFITNHHLPDFIRLGALFGLNLLFGWNKNEYTTDYKLYGWLTISNGGLALLMASRTNLFSIIARIPSPTLLLYHRWIGIATIVHATTHVAFNIRHSIMTDQLAGSYENTRIRVGTMAWVALVLMGITSLNFVRRRWFEAFYYAHALFFVFVVGALIHTTNGPEFLLPGLFLWAIDRAIRFYNNFRHVTIKSVAHYPGDLVKIKFEGLKTTRPGQIAWIQIPGVSFLNWHPFTIASAPGEKEATVAVRGLGGYTKKLMKLGSSAGNAPIEVNEEEMTQSYEKLFKLRLDGPYGVGGIQWGLYPVTVLVAGGIGITPGISIATHIIKRAALPDTNTGVNGQWHIHLLWVIKDIEHLHWFKDELRILSTLAAAPAVPVTFDITVHVTGGDITIPLSTIDFNSSKEQQEAWDMEPSGEAASGEYKFEGFCRILQGRPDMMKWFEDVKTARPGSDAGVNICGPRSLIDAARKAAAKASSKDGLFYVEEEVFEL